MEIVKNLKEAGESIADSLKERISGPMYGYFVIAWCITNWKPIISLFFIEQDLIYRSKHILKIKYITDFYPFSSFWWGFWSIAKLVLIPALATWLCVWFINRLGVVFYKKNLEHKIKRDIAKRQAEYDVASYQYATEHSDAIIDDERIYNENEDFNQWYDEENPIKDFSASEGLFRTDPIAYKAQIEDWKRELKKDELRDEIIDEHMENLRGEAQYEMMRDRDE
jgi:hypothetical protein